MKIQVHIERLILEGLPVSGHDASRVQAAVAAELGRLIGAQGIGEPLRTAGAVAAIPAGALRLDPNTGPAQMGARIARSVYACLGRPL